MTNSLTAVKIKFKLQLDCSNHKLSQINTNYFRVVEFMNVVHARILKIKRISFYDHISVYSEHSRAYVLIQIVSSDSYIFHYLERMELLY